MTVYDKKFQYMLLLRGATQKAVERAIKYLGFNTCSSCEEQLLALFLLLGFGSVSIHAPLARSNYGDSYTGFVIYSFNTCSSCEEQR